MYDVTDEAEVEVNTEEAFLAITNLYDGHSRWWMPFLSCKLLKGESSRNVGATYKVTIHDIVPVSFIAETIDAKPGELLKVRYTKGAFHGEGLWTFNSNGNGTNIRFRWQTKPAVPFLRFLALFYPLSKNHSKVMQKGFEGLKNSLKARQSSNSRLTQK